MKEPSSWRNHEGGIIMEESSRRDHQEGIMKEESSRRNHQGGIIMEGSSGGSLGAWLAMGRLRGNLTSKVVFSLEITGRN